MKKKKSNKWVVFVGIAYTLCLGCNSTERNNPKLTVKQVVTDSNIAPISIEDIYGPQRYIDSLNELKDFKNMPYFLRDSCIDANVIYWKDLHHPTSVRKYVMENTNNVELLKYIVENNLYTSKCNAASPNKSIPFYYQSWNDMAKERLSSLK